MEKEVYIKIHGRVQGIGFRWWAVKTAEEIGGISGWVHNAADGSVDVLMSGEEENIDKMLSAVEQSISQDLQMVKTNRKELESTLRKLQVEDNLKKNQK